MSDLFLWFGSFKLLINQDSPLLLVNNHIVFNLEAVVTDPLSTAKEADQVVDDPVIPIRQQQQLLASIRVTSFGSTFQGP